MTKSLQSLYYDPLIGLTTKERFYERIKKFGFSRKQVYDFVDKQSVDQQHRQITNKSYHSIIGQHNSYQGDLFFYNQYRKQNKNFCCALVLIEVTTRKAYAYPMKKKSETTDKFKLFLKDIHKEINVLNTDLGSEFTSKKFNKLMKDNKITHYFSQVGDHNKQGKVERFIRTIRGLIERYFTAKGSVVWYDILNKLIENYNNTKNRAIGMTPNEVKLIDEDKIRNNEIEKGQFLTIELGYIQSRELMVIHLF